MTTLSQDVQRAVRTKLWGMWLREWMKANKGNPPSKKDISTAKYRIDLAVEERIGHIVLAVAKGHSINTFLDET